uniref:Uncharacterized protein n=1 Tax=Panagrolaimus superbus TaxID=310955 RepID=A0A914YZB7_9BILA
MSRNFHSTNSESESDEELKILSWKNAYEQQKQSSPKFDKFRIQDYQDLQEDYYKIIEIASELIDCLEQTCSGKTVSCESFN